MPKYYIVDSFACVIKYTDDLETAIDLAKDDDCYIIDTSTNEQINFLGEREEILEHKC